MERGSRFGLSRSRIRLEDVRSRSAVHPRTVAEPEHARPLVIFDGDCVLCDRSLQFVHAHASAQTFDAVPRSSAQAQSVLTAFPEANTVDGLLVIEEGKLFARSAAALRIVRRLRPPWPLLGAAAIVPRPWRDALYDAVARRRYRWFGRLTTDPNALVAAESRRCGDAEGERGPSDGRGSR